MKTKFIPGIIVLSLAVLLSACNKPSLQEPDQTKDKNEVKSERFSQKSTLKNLLGMGKNLTCTYSFVDSETNMETKGTTYISGKKIAQETETVSSEDKTKTLRGFMISDGEYFYTWSSDKKGSGMKIKIEASDPENKTVKTDVAGAQKNTEMEYDMDCNPWSVDETKFTLPEDIKFTDLSEMMKNLPAVEGLPTMPAISTVPK